MNNRWLTFIGAAVVVLVVGANAAGEVGFGVSGAPLLVTTATGVYACAAVAFLVWRTAPAGGRVALLLVMGAAVSAIQNGDPGGPVVGLFLLMAFAPLRLEPGTAAAVAVATALTFNLQQAASASEPAVFVAVTNGGAALLFALGWLLRREQQQRVRLELTRDAERRAATLSERTRLAREIHDVLAHSLSGLALQLEAARLLARSTGADDRMVAAVERALGLSHGGLADARQAVSALRDDAVHGPEQLGSLIDEHRVTGGPCRLVVDGEPRQLSPDARLAVFRTAQEALSNVRKHTSGQQALVRLSWTAAGAVLAVEDTGTPATPAVPGRVAPGYGLSGLAERADLLGADLTAGPTPEGFRVELAVPASL